MTQNVLQTAAEEPIAWLVKFEWGYGSDLLYTNWGADLTVDSADYTADPALGFRPGKRTVGTADEDWRIEMQTDILPASRLIRGRYWGDIDVTVQAVSPDDLSNPVVLFLGRIAGTIRKQTNTAELICEPLKNILLSRRLGLVATREDNFWLGASQTNAVDLSTLRETGTISALQTNGKPNRVTVTFDGTPTEPDENDRWRTGYIEVLGERIRIRRAVGSNDRYDLAAKPDESWDGEACTLTPGWDGTYEHARDYWSGKGVDLITDFTGYGYKMPNRNPIYSSG